MRQTHSPQRKELSARTLEELNGEELLILPLTFDVERRSEGVNRHAPYADQHFTPICVWASKILSQNRADLRNEVGSETLKLHEGNRNLQEAETGI